MGDTCVRICIFSLENLVNNYKDFLYKEFLKRIFLYVSVNLNYKVSCPCDLDKSVDGWIGWIKYLVLLIAGTVWFLYDIPS